MRRPFKQPPKEMLDQAAKRVFDERPSGICPHCGEKVPLRDNGTIETHDFPKPCRSVCPGSGSDTRMV